MPEDCSGSVERKLWTGTRIVKRELRELGARPVKRRGQHFLVSARTAKRIVDACRIGKGDTVIEVGSGLGALTIPLSWTGAKVIAVEMDRTLAGALESKLAGSGNVKVLALDFLDWDPTSLPDSARPMVIVGNLPYYASTDIVLKILSMRRLFSRAVLTLQREYAERLCAGPGSRHYGSLSVLVSLHAAVRTLFSLHPRAFYPVPKVGSRVVVLSIRSSSGHDSAEEQRIERVVRIAFSERRKTILNSLSKGFACPKDELRKSISACGVSPEARPEELSLEDFALLSGSVPQARAVAE